MRKNNNQYENFGRMVAGMIAHLIYALQSAPPPDVGYATKHVTGPWGDAVVIVATEEAAVEFEKFCASKYKIVEAPRVNVN